MKLLIDDREDKDRVSKLSKIYDVEVSRLETGDIIAYDDVRRESGEEPRDIAIEVKTRQDFIASCKNRRIQEEALKMKEAYPYSYIIVYDDGKLNSKYSYQTLPQRYGNITSLMLKYKVPVFWVENFNHFTICLDSIITTANIIDEPIDPPLVRPKDSNEMINVLIGINSVGKKMANKLLDKFKTPGGVFRATDEELDEIPRLSAKAKGSIKRMR